MRVFTAVRHSIDPRFYYGRLWSGDFYSALKELGCDIVESEVDLLPASRFMEIPGNFTRQEKETRSRITREITDEVKKAHSKKPVDLFLSYFYNAHFEPAGFEEIHRLGIPTVNFYCNSIYQFELVKTIAEKVKFSWHTEKNARELYLEAGAKPVWVQMGASHRVYHPVPGTVREKKACFIGRRYADRDRWLEKLVTDDIPVDIYGTGWLWRRGDVNKYGLAGNHAMYLGRRRLMPGTLNAYAHAALANIRKLGLVKGARRIAKQLQYRNESRKVNNALAGWMRGFAGDINKTFARYEVVLNFSNIWQDGRPGSRLMPHVRLRDFEAPMCRTCYLTGYTDEIAEFYELGKEIDTYHTPEELVDKVRFYLIHPASAEKLREAGYRRALRDHTWKRRFETLFAKIRIKNK
ncbi:MAG: glycosyltransferase [Candidatus Omnitrophota bacterium]